MESLRMLRAIVFITLALHTTALIQSPPRIVKQPPTDELLFQVAHRKNENDRPFIIECEAEAEPAPTYKWIKNGKKFDWQAYNDRISQQPGRGTLVFTSPRDEDHGQYQCFARNEWGTATSNSVFVREAKLNGFEAGPPITVTAHEGEPFKLTCQSPGGWPKPELIWIFQNVDGGIRSINNSRMTLDPEGKLWFSNVTSNDESSDSLYVCAAVSKFRNEYKLGNGVRLNVVETGISASQSRHKPEQQYVSKKNEVVLRGKKIELYCIFSGTPLPQTVWRKDGRSIQSSDQITQGNYGKSLVIKHAQFEDNGTYTCEVSNGVGEAKSYSIHLQVMAAPYFKQEPEITNAGEGETVEFICKASGNPEPQINWIYNGLPINLAPPNPHRTVSTDTIIIRNVGKQETGNYGCNATNSLGYAYKDVYINVLEHTRITEEPEDSVVAAGSSAMFHCNAVSDASLALHIGWLSNGQPIDFEKTPRFVQSSDFSLTISDTTERDSGTYTCVAKTELDEATAQATLTVQV